jgi:molybdopterin synthase catalytic subunit
MVQLTFGPIDTQAVLETIADVNAGANLLFVGTTRQWTGDRRTLELRYESYEAMAEQELTSLCHEARTRWELAGVAVVHRLGIVPAGEASLAVAVSSRHRLAAFEAGQWLIDRIKQVVPVWKQEVDQEGFTIWVHPAPAQTASVSNDPVPAASASGGIGAGSVDRQ